jgi:hypothetical protein
MTLVCQQPAIRGAEFAMQIHFATYAIAVMKDDTNCVSSLPAPLRTALEQLLAEGVSVLGVGDRLVIVGDVLQSHVQALSVAQYAPAVLVWWLQLNSSFPLRNLTFMD